MYGHIETLAKEIQKGASSVPGVEATLFQVKILGYEFLVNARSEPIVKEFAIVGRGLQ
jgi:multimeric flavodoxin WrbA